MTQLREHYEAPDGLSSLHLLSYDAQTDTVTYEERVSIKPLTGDDQAQAMAPRTTTAALWTTMTGGDSG